MTFSSRSIWIVLGCLLGLAAIARPAGAADTPDAPATFQGLTFDPPKDALQTFSLAFDRAATVRVHDSLIDQHFFYLDFYGVADPGGNKDWAPGGAGVFHIKQIYYAPQKVLRFVFYCRGDAWFSVQSHGSALHEIQVRPINYVSLGKATADLGGTRKRVVIDAGHGGTPEQGKYHFGARTSVKVDGAYVYEKLVTMQIAQRLRALIEKAPNLEATMTRDRDVYVGLQERIDLARKAKGDLFLSIHMNDSGSRSHDARGFEIYYLSDGTKETNHELLMLENEGVDLDDTLSYQQSLRDLMKQLANEAMGLRQTESQQLAQIIDEEFKRGGPFRKWDRGVKSAPFRVLMNFEMPAVLAECGFLDNPAEGRQLLDPDVQQRIATLLFDGINRYFAMEDPAFRPTRVEVTP